MKNKRKSRNCKKWKGHWKKRKKKTGQEVEEEVFYGKERGRRRCKTGFN